MGVLAGVGSVCVVSRVLVLPGFGYVLLLFGRGGRYRLLRAYRQFVQCGPQFCIRGQIVVGLRGTM